MSKREEYNACIASGLKGKQFNKEQRKLEFCIVSKTCSGKATNREEAQYLCSLPKEPKPVKATRKGGAKSCEKEVVELSKCMLDYFEANGIYKQVLNINSVGVAMTNAMMECRRCQE